MATKNYTTINASKECNTTKAKMARENAVTLNTHAIHIIHILLLYSILNHKAERLRLQAIGTVISASLRGRDSSR